MNSQLNSSTITTFPSACQGTFTGTSTPCFAIGGFFEESSVRAQRLELTIHKSRYPIDVLEATALTHAAVRKRRGRGSFNFTARDGRRAAKQ